MAASLKGQLVIMWEEPGGEFLKTVMTIEGRAKRSLWQLYRQIQEARGVTPDGNNNPDFGKTGARAKQQRHEGAAAYSPRFHTLI